MLRNFLFLCLRLSLTLLVVLGVPLVPLPLLLQLLLQLPLFLHFAADPLLQILLILLGLRQVLLHLVEVRLLTLQCPLEDGQLLLARFVLDAEVLHALLQLLFAPLFRLDLEPLGLDNLLDVRDLLFGVCALLLHLLDLVEPRGAYARQHLCVLLQHVAVLFQLLPLRGQLAELHLLLGVHARSLVDPPLEVHDLGPVLLDGLLRGPLLV
mmetsp:Transcript_87247/g.267021  ORF Transcript_87247/g.267021 Transcript_87247/m.267021 type:complete len:210 (-) Transcript_87247:432-1061(-)